MADSGKVLVRWRVRLGYPVGFACLLVARPTARSLVLGAVFAALGLIMRGVAAGYLRKAEVLATGGPYAYTRNPLYLGSAVLAAGFLVAANSWIASVIAFAYFVILYPAVMYREARELRAVYGAEYEAYAASVPLFWPRLVPPRFAGNTRGTQFSWAIYRRNREYQAALGSLAVFAVLWLLIYLRR